MTILTTAQLKLSLVTEADAADLHAYYTRNYAHLAPWEPLRPAGFHDVQAWQARAALQHQNAQKDQSYHFIARPLGGGDILAIVNFNNVVRGAFQACHLGYSIDCAAQGKGLMQEALTALIAHMFDDRGLHRIMANYMPRNTRSGRLLTRLGFEQEGRARDYLMIAGKWEDHILTAKINPEASAKT